MAEVLLFHHIQGLTEGVKAFADELRAGGHTVHVPDLYDGQTFGSIEEGFALPEGRRRRCAGRRRVADLPAGPGLRRLLLGRPAAQRLAQTRPARRARCSTSRASRSPASGRSARGPTAYRCRSTAMDEDEFFAKEGDMRRRPRAGRDGRAGAGRALHLPRRRAPVHRPQPAVVRRRGRRPGPAAQPGVPRPRLGRRCGRLPGMGRRARVVATPSAGGAGGGAVGSRGARPSTTPRATPR